MRLVMCERGGAAGRNVNKYSKHPLSKCECGVCFNLGIERKVRVDETIYESNVEVQGRVGMVISLLKLWMSFYEAVVGRYYRVSSARKVLRG